MTGRLIRITTALAVASAAGVAAIISYQHAYELVRSHSESGATARLAPFTVDGLIWADGDAGRESAEPARTTAGWLEPCRRHRGDSGCQPGARRGPRASRSAGQRVASRGTCWLV